MVLTSQDLADGGKGKISLLAKNEHGDLSCHGSVFVSPPALQDLLINGEVGRYSVYHLLIGYVSPCWGVENVTNGLLDEIYGD